MEPVLFEKINNLSSDLIHNVFGYLPLFVTMWLNKSGYSTNHKIVKDIINPLMYDAYIRDMVRKDNYFVFNLILQENRALFILKKNFVYKRVLYSNYAFFISDYCVKNNSTNCRNILVEETGLSQNQHKKNQYLNIRWKI